MRSLKNGGVDFWYSSIYKIEEAQSDSSARDMDSQEHPPLLDLGDVHPFNFRPPPLRRALDLPPPRPANAQIIPFAGLEDIRRLLARYDVPEVARHLPLAPLPPPPRPELIVLSDDDDDRMDLVTPRSPSPPPPLRRPDPETINVDADNAEQGRGEPLSQNIYRDTENDAPRSPQDHEPPRQDEDGEEGDAPFPIFNWL